MIIVILFFCYSIYALWRHDEEKKITWIGCPMVSDNDKYTPSQGWISSQKIGLRKDGIVVWKENK